MVRASCTRMAELSDLETLIANISSRLDAIDNKLEHLASGRRKSMEWIAQLSEHVGSLDAFREDVRATLEPLYDKLENVEDGLRVLRHATSDVSRRVESLEQPSRRAVNS
jgi:chromosome segregation ATPase